MHSLNAPFVRKPAGSSQCNGQDKTVTACVAHDVPPALSSARAVNV
jgi:hypothetical protein